MCSFRACRLFLLLAAACSLWISGCQCCGFTEHYADLIDDVSDQKVALDCLYCPSTDLNRIGKPDWAACPINRVLCKLGRGCSSNGCLVEEGCIAGDFAVQGCSDEGCVD